MKRSSKIAIIVFISFIVVTAMVAIGATVYWRRTHARTKAYPKAVPDRAEPRLVVQLGHSGAVSSAAYSPDGRFIVSSGKEDRVAILWEAATGREIRRFNGHRNQINSVAFSPDGGFVLTGSGGGELGEQASEVQDFTARLWDIRDGKEIRKFEGHKGIINAVSFSPDGKSIATASDDKTVRIWDTSSGIFNESTFNELTLNAAVKSIAYSPDNRFLLIGGGSWDGWGSEKCDDCFASLWNRSSLTASRDFGAQTRAVGSVVFSADSRFILLGPITPHRDNELLDAGEEVKLDVSQWDIITGQKVRDYEGFGPAVFSPDSHYVVTAGAGPHNAGAQIWEARTGQNLHYIEGFYYGEKKLLELGVVRAIAISPDSKVVLTGFDTIKNSGNFISEQGEKAVHLFSADSGQKQLSLIGDTAKHDVTELLVGVNPIGESTDFIQIGNTLWNKSSGTKVSLQGVTKATNLSPPQMLSRHGSLMLSAVSNDSGSRFTIWKTNTGEKVNDFANEGHAAWMTPNNRYVLFESVSTDSDPAGEGFLLSWFDIRTGKLKWQYKLEIMVVGANSRYLNQESAYSILSPKGDFIYAIVPSAFLSETDPLTGETVEPRENELLVIETESGTVLKRIELPREGGAQGIHVSPDGRYLGFDEAIYDTVSDRFLYQVRGRNAVFLGNGNILVSPKEGTGQLWNPRTEKMIKELPFKNDFTTRTIFSPDASRSLVRYNSLDDNNVVSLFDVSKGAELFKFEHYDLVTSSAFSSDGRFVVTSSEDGSSRIWSATTGKELCRLSSFKNGDWIVTTPEGRFDANNLENIRSLHWVMSSEPLRLLPLEIFMRQYYEPRLLARVLAGEQMKPLPSLAELNRTQPDVRIKDVRPDSADTVAVTVEVASTRSVGQKDSSGRAIDSGVFDVRLFRNGQLVAYAPNDDREKKSPSAWDSVRSWFSDPPSSDGEIALDESGKGVLKFPGIKLPRTGVDQVEFSAYAFNCDRIKSPTDRKPYKIDPKPTPIKGRAYIISLGVNAYEKNNLNLRFAANDARQTQMKLVGQLAKEASYEEVIGISLISDYTVTLANGRTVASQEASVQEARSAAGRITENNARKSHLKAVLDVLAGRTKNEALLKEIPGAEKLRAAHPEDLIIISVSSHGYTDSDGTFYIVPSDTGTAEIRSPEFRQHCISSDELSVWLRDVDADQLVMVIDACHSSAAVEGTGFKPGPMGSRGLGQLSYDKGMRILTATQADNVALETNKVRQGLLMYALLEDGLGAWLADYKPRDKSIDLSEWLNYGMLRVPRLYDELKSGQVQTSKGTAKVVRETVVTDQSSEDRSEGKTQQPSLFDFSRRAREIVIARNH